MVLRTMTRRVRRVSLSLIKAPTMRHMRPIARMFTNGRTRSHRVGREHSSHFGSSRIGRIGRMASGSTFGTWVMLKQTRPRASSHRVHGYFSYVLSEIRSDWSKYIFRRSTWTKKNGFQYSREFTCSRCVRRTNICSNV